MDITPPGAFGNSHWINLPQPLEDMITGEGQWLWKPCNHGSLLTIRLYRDNLTHQRKVSHAVYTTNNALVATTRETYKGKEQHLLGTVVRYCWARYGSCKLAGLPIAASLTVSRRNFSCSSASVSSAGVLRFFLLKNFHILSPRTTQFFENYQTSELFCFSKGTGEPFYTQILIRPDKLFMREEFGTKLITFSKLLLKYW